MQEGFTSTMAVKEGSLGTSKRLLLNTIRCSITILPFMVILQLAYDFWGPDKLVFGADLPLGDSYWGARSYRATINAINDMEIPDADKKKIFIDNAAKLLRIPI